MKRIVKSFAKLVLRKIGIPDTLYLQIRNKDSFRAQSRLLRGKKNPVIFDIGGLDGRTSATYRRQFPDSTIHIFEPFPTSCQLIRKKFNSDPLVVINQVALSDKIGKEKFHVNASPATNSLLSSNKVNTQIDRVTRTQEIIDVDVDTVDHYCAVNNIDFIDILKMDVQGGELRILQGAGEMIASGRVGMLFSELGFIKIYSNQPLEHDITAYLEKYGYALFSMFSFSYLGDGQMSYCDGIYVPVKGFERP
jgi:FkbM family methyltransferase